MGVPSGRVPTTHILKHRRRMGWPCGERAFFAPIARTAGLIVPNSTVQHFGDEIAIVVERYDRVRSGGRWSRIHQETCVSAWPSSYEQV